VVALFVGDHDADSIDRVSARLKVTGGVEERGRAGLTVLAGDPGESTDMDTVDRDARTTALLRPIGVLHTAPTVPERSTDTASHQRGSPPAPRSVR
jgi:hypothetical protein